ncbi:hypothetical protein EES43_23060 [Streptomyces sp. ADI96-02]|uniref:hypothetical protein n=1 Tax=Streptomyces sp. ADI96-02 TaxID=1522760 RepID=UPI000F553F2D|nr:hypothetical protein [Streptomyces sp. ADI96-02]RPK56980.1 hypothetical protein EES43_23060 [Streptomyces sp. ADI96-02]
MTSLGPVVHTIGGILVSARPFADYQAQFALTGHDLTAGPLLDCPGGASDFGATVRERGGQVISVDPCYVLPAADMTVRVAAELERVAAWTSAQPDRFPLDSRGSWTHAPAWQATAAGFLSDYAADRALGKGCYLPAALPRLPFTDGTFRLALSGFLLFTYPDHFDLAFHVRAAEELLRVAHEVRLHPLNDSGGIPYPHLDVLLTRLRARGITCDVLEVTGRSDARDTRTLRLKRR